jgi:hypothetical protein
LVGVMRFAGAACQPVAAASLDDEGNYSETGQQSQESAQQQLNPVQIHELKVNFYK